MNISEKIVAYHKNRAKLPKLHYYCLNCGIKFNEPSNFKSCDACNYEYKSGMKYASCKKCGTSKPYNKYGLCFNCYKYIDGLDTKEQNKNERRN